MGAAGPDVALETADVALSRDDILGIDNIELLETIDCCRYSMELPPLCSKPPVRACSVRSSVRHEGLNGFSYYSQMEPIVRIPHGEWHVEQLRSFDLRDDMRIPLPTM
jgi:hypothetical protein